jgi:hypothetical protein
MKILMSVIVVSLLALSGFELLPWATSGFFILCAFTGAYIYHYNFARD